MQVLYHSLLLYPMVIALCIKHTVLRLRDVEEGTDRFMHWNHILSPGYRTRERPTGGNLERRDVFLHPWHISSVTHYSSATCHFVYTTFVASKSAMNNGECCIFWRICHGVVMQVWPKWCHWFCCVEHYHFATVVSLFSSLRYNLLSFLKEK